MDASLTLRSNWSCVTGKVWVATSQRPAPSPLFYDGLFSVGQLGKCGGSDSTCGGDGPAGDFRPRDGRDDEQIGAAAGVAPRGIYLRSGSGGPGGQGTLSSNILSDILLGRWRLSLILFGRVFLEDVGVEPGSVIYELNGFPVKEAKFRRYMEKLRNAQQKDLTMSKMWE
ncbi:hypothetical protein quinque_001757 [Culex quinquefasciatus]